MALKPKFTVDPGLFPLPPSQYVAPTLGTPGSAGYTPDYSSLLGNDTLLKQQKADLAAHGIQSAADRKAAVDQALTTFGEVPDFASTISGLGLSPQSALFQSLMGDVDQSTIQGANDLTSAGLSTTAQLDKTHQANVDQFLAQLASRGIVRSGQTGVSEANENQNYLGAQFNARNTLLQYLAGVQAAFAQAQQVDQQSLATDLGDATTRQIAENPATAPVAPIAGSVGTNADGTTATPPNIGDTTGYYNAADYFAAHPLGAGTTNAQGQAALAEAGRQLGGSTNTLALGPSSGYSFAPDTVVPQVVNAQPPANTQTPPPFSSTPPPAPASPSVAARAYGRLNMNSFL